MKVKSKLNKKVPNLRFPEFEGEWETVKIKDFGIIVTGNTPPTKDIDNYGYDYLWASPADLGKSKYITDTKTMLSERGFKKTRKLPKGSILVTCIGSTIGKMGMTLKEMATNQQINSIVVNKNFDCNFVYYAVDSQFPKYISSISMQAVPIISKSVFEELNNYSISIEEQKKIGSFFSLLDDRISTQIQIIEEMKSLKKGVSKKLFSQKIRFKEFIDEWKLMNLEEVCDFYKGSPLSKNDIVENGILKCIHYGELFTIYEAIISDIVSYTNNEGFKSKIGDILMPSSDVTPLGLATASAILEDNVVLGGDINILRPKTNINSIFLSYFLNTEKKKIIELVSGTTIKHIYSKDLKQIKILIPCIEEQEKIANLLSAIDKKIETEKHLLKKYTEQKKYLLANMFV